MMLVGLYLPVCLGGAVIAPNGEPPQYSASRFLPTRVGWVWLLLLKANHPNDDASRF